MSEDVSTSPAASISRPLRGMPGRLFTGQATGVIVATVALALVVGMFKHSFLSSNQLLTMLQSSVYVGLIAAGMTYLIAMREIDLSVGSIFGLSVVGLSMAMSHGIKAWLTIPIGLALGLLMGGANALIVRYLGIPLIVTTLATMSVFRGAAIAVTHGQPVYNLPATDSFFTVLGGKAGPVPVGLIIGVVVLIPVAVLMNHTPFGFRVRAIGSNPDAAASSGISISRVRLQVLLLVGLLCAIAAVLGLAFFQSGDPNIGTGYELQAIAAAVIGGTPLRGGSASVVGAAVGAVLLNIVASALVFFSVPANWSSLATGVVILLAVGIDSLIRRRRAHSLSAAVATSSNALQQKESQS